MAANGIWTSEMAQRQGDADLAYQLAYSRRELQSAQAEAARIYDAGCAAPIEHAAAYQRALDAAAALVEAHSEDVRVLAREQYRRRQLAAVAGIR